MGRERDDDDDDGDDEAEELADVEVERMPDLGGWEYFKAVDEASERWTLALQPRLDQKAIEYAFWTDIKKDPAATGVLDARREADKRWVKAVDKSRDGALDNAARAEVILAILRQHDPTLDSYEARLLFTLDPPSEEADEDDEDDEDEDEDEDEDA